MTMMQSQQSEVDYSTVQHKAFDLLSRREYSRFELRQKLGKLAPPELVEEVLTNLIKKGMQSDARFTEMLCRSRFNGGKGPIKLEYELHQHQIDPDIIAQSMAEYDDQWAESAERERQKKFGKRPENYQEWAKQARFLQQRGFNSHHFDSFNE